MPAFSGGVSIDKKGYLVIKAGPCRDVRVHILVAEAMLGRKLLKGEEVHHRDENKLNPEWTNLEVLDSITHAKISNKKRWMLKDQDMRELEAIEAFEASKDLCPDCNGTGAWGQTSPRGIGGQQITQCRTCLGYGTKLHGEVPF